MVRDVGDLGDLGDLRDIGGLAVPGDPPALDDLAALLEELSNACGLPGDEREVRDLLHRVLEPHVDEIRTDPIGNLLCRRGGGPVRVMLDAHMDEVGLMVAGYADGGLLRVRECGAIDPRVLAGRSVLVGRDRVPGVIGLRPVHFTDPAERDRATPVKDLLVDIGARTGEEAAAAAPLGSPVYFSTRFERLSDRVVKGKALDDRIGCAALARLLTAADYPGLTLYGAFTVQEEAGLRGAQVAAYNLDPHVALALEATSCADVPGVTPPDTATHLGAGPAITLMDGTIVTHQRVRDRLVALAEEHGVPYQFRRLTTAGTDSGAIFLARTGVPACTVAAPCRYIHGPAALADLHDIAALVRLVDLFLDSLDRGEFSL